MSKVFYLKILCDLVESDLLTEWQAGFLTGLFVCGRKDYSFYKLSKFLYQGLRNYK